MEVSPSEPRFMPQRVTVHGGPTADTVQEISSVSINGFFLCHFEALLWLPIS